MKPTIRMLSVLFLQSVCLSCVDVSAQVARDSISELRPVTAAAPTSTPSAVGVEAAAPVNAQAPVPVQFVALGERLATGRGHAAPPGDCSNHARIFALGPYNGGYFCSIGRFLDCTDSEYKDVFFPLEWVTQELLWPMFPGGVMMAGYHYRYEWQCVHPEPGRPSYSGACTEEAD